MEERKGYDVLKIVVHSDRCYMSTDYVAGKQLIVWLKYHSRIEKELLFGWIRELLENLKHFHQCRGNPSYQYVNPYSIIVGENEKLYLLDLGSRDQEELLHLMQRRYVRENFLSPDNQYYQKASVREDIYGFGKTVQYLLSAIEVEPQLRRLEELRLQRMISRCSNNSKKSYQTIQEISDHFPSSRNRDHSKIPSLRKAFLCAAILAGVAVAAIRIADDNEWSRKDEKGEKPAGDLSDTEDHDSKILEDYREEMQQRQEQWDISKQEIEEASAKRERELVYELALLYFIELEDYGKSGEAAGSLGEGDKFAKDFVTLCGFMEGKLSEVTQEDMEELLERLKREAPDADERYAYCISKGYQRIQDIQKEAEAAQENETPSMENKDGAEDSADLSAESQIISDEQE